MLHMYRSRHHQRQHTKATNKSNPGSHFTYGTLALELKKSTASIGVVAKIRAMRMPSPTTRIGLVGSPPGAWCPWSVQGMTSGTLTAYCPAGTRSARCSPTAAVMARCSRIQCRTAQRHTQRGAQSANKCQHCTGHWRFLCLSPRPPPPPPCRSHTSPRSRGGKATRK